MRNMPHCLGLLCLALLFACGPNLAYGQYKTMPFGAKFDPSKSDKAEKTAATFRQRKKRVVKGDEDWATGQKFVKEYYYTYLFPAMTQRATRGKIADLRAEVLQDLVLATPEARPVIYDYAQKFGRLVVTGKYHPATRYNGLLLLGQLNREEGDNNTPPIPDSSQLRYLQGSLTSSKVPPLLKYGAILGMLRHAELKGHPSRHNRTTPSSARRWLPSWARLLSTVACRNQITRMPTIGCAPEPSKPSAICAMLVHKTRS